MSNTTPTSDELSTLDACLAIARRVAMQAWESRDNEVHSALMHLIVAVQESPAYTPTLTLAKSMAVAVINDDEAAALALADMLVNNPSRKELNERAKPFMNQRLIGDGFDVYHWPEFQTFAARLGIIWDHATVDLTIVIPCRGPVKVIHSHHGFDLGGSKTS